MSRNLLTDPYCRSVDLGYPMPPEQHAVSACLPLWEHNIGYEEGDPQILSKLQAAYPRFCLHPRVAEVCDRFLNTESRRGLPFASRKSALRALSYIQHAAAPAAEPQLHDFGSQNAVGVTVAADHFPVLKQYWQHAGENVSSRVAVQILEGRVVPVTESRERTDVKRRVAEFQRVSEKDVFLFPSGMAAMAAAWRLSQTISAGSSCQYGFPYVDTLKIQQRFTKHSCLFLPLGNETEFEQLENLSRQKKLSAIFCEVPTNPLLKTPDLNHLRQIADSSGALLIIDDTLAACGNLNLLPYADVLVTSLTKYFSGTGNVLAGSLAINSDGARAGQLHELLAAEFEETLSNEDVEALCRNSEDYLSRVTQMNGTTCEMVEYLRRHPLVETVFHPSIDRSLYDSLRVRAGGYGGLLSFVLKEPAVRTPSFFDALEVCKGPNLGTKFTLCCPYTILAHYGELDFVETCGVSRWLLRLSVGLESIDELTERFDRAFYAIKD